MRLAQQKLWTTCLSGHHLSRSRVRIGLVMVILGLLVAWSGGVSSAMAATYYIGAFTGSSPSDTPGCGTQVTPCATLAYWTENRRSVLSPQNNDVVRIAPGTYTSSNTNHCIIPTDSPSAGQSITYEGRSASDGPPDPSSMGVVIDGGTVGAGGPCHQQAIRCDGCLFNRFVLRDMTLRNYQNSGSHAWFNPGGPSTGLTIERVRFTGGANTGLVIGDISQQSGSASRVTTNVTIVGSSFSNNSGNGLWLAAVDGFTITGSLFNNNGPGNDRDGLHIGASINGVITDSEAANNGEDGFDVSRNGGADVCQGNSYNITFERNAAHDNPNANFSMNNCSWNLIYRNNFAWGDGIGLNQYFCAHNITYQNNTIRTADTAVQLFSGATGMTIENNILTTTVTGPTIFTDKTAIGTGNQSVWRYNIVVCQGCNAMVTGNVGDGDNPACFSDPDFTANGGIISTARPGATYTNDGLQAFQQSGDFPSTPGGDCPPIPGGTAAGDKWGTTPAFVNAANPPSVANLHLDNNDTIAKDKGMSISSFDRDYDQQFRPQGPCWDIGADER